MSYDRYPDELRRIVQSAPNKMNFALSAAALMIGVGKSIQDSRVQELSTDFWAKNPEPFRNSTHSFLVDLVDNAPGINLEWCKRWLVPRLVTVEFRTDSPRQAVEYIFSEGWTGKADYESVLSLTLNNPGDLKRPGWKVSIKESNAEGSTVGAQYLLPRHGKHNGNQVFSEVANSIQNGLVGASCTRIPT